MMKLSKLIKIDDDNDPIISSVTTDSRECKQGSLFIAIKGANTDGADYIDQAIAKGAAAVVMDNYEKVPQETKVLTIVVQDARHSYSQIAAKLFPRQPDVVVAVTGTNGKTSIVDYCRQIWHLLGYKSGSIGTIGVIENEIKLNQSDAVNMTTPDPINLHKLLQRLCDNGTQYVAMEASSHGLDQHRLDSVRIRAAAFSNFTQDHLDYHGSMEKYLEAKLLLFKNVMKENGLAILNSDIAEYSQIADFCSLHGHRIVTYGKSASDFIIKDIKVDFDSMDVSLQIFGVQYEIRLNMIGEFQVYNVICALALVVESGAELDLAMKVLPNIKAPSGRLEKVVVSSDTSNMKRVYVDYAHTPDALEKVLQYLRKVLLMTTKGKLHLVFGCGGNRDQAKRKLMAIVAKDCADVVIITDDNPRSEDPGEIRREILTELPEASEMANRAKAIENAIKGMNDGDILLIAGKGHENYQIYGDNKYPFDDVEEARKWL